MRLFFPKSLQSTSHSPPIRMRYGVYLRVQTLVNTLPQSLQWCMQYHVILDCIVMASDSMYIAISIITWRVCWNVFLLRWANFERLKKALIFRAISFRKVKASAWSSQLLFMTLCESIELSRIKLKTWARSYDEWAFSPLDFTAIWLSHLALAIYMFVVVNFDALAQASNIRI